MNFANLGLFPVAEFSPILLGLILVACLAALRK
jgi:hypothetical protein